MVCICYNRLLTYSANSEWCGNSERCGCVAMDYRLIVRIAIVYCNNSVLTDAAGPRSRDNGYEDISPHASGGLQEVRPSFLFTQSQQLQ